MLLICYCGVTVGFTAAPGLDKSDDRYSYGHDIDDMVSFIVINHLGVCSIVEVKYD